MDKSKIYMNMCEQAKEIQQAFNLIVDSVEKIRIAKEQNVDIDKIIWLPRQDQLQDMLIDEGYGNWAVMLDRCRAWYIDESYPTIINSMEQLWLAFVMHEKYGKRWDENDWVKI